MHGDIWHNNSLVAYIYTANWPVIPCKRLRKYLPFLLVLIAIQRKFHLILRLDDNKYHTDFQKTKTI